MPRQRSSASFDRACTDELAFRMTLTATAPMVRISSGERKPMHTATKNTLVAAAALAAAGLFGSLPYHGSLQAQGVPVQHHDVALVDTTSDLLGAETSLDDQLFGSIFGSSGTEAELYNGLATALGGGTTGDADATALLDATGASPIYSGDFDGAISRFSEGLFLNTWAGEDEFNQLLGISATTSETAILADINQDFVPLPTGDTLPVAGAPGFDADLMSIASQDYTLAAGDFEGWLGNLPTALGDLGGGSDILTGLLGDLGGSGGLDGLGGILGTLLTDLGASIF
jgi:hypothetical protein